MPAHVHAAAAAHRRQTLADSALLAVTLVWGVTFPLVKSALRDADALRFCAVRMSLAALLLVAFYRPGWRRISATTWGAGAILGLLLGCGYALQTAGLALTGPATAAFLTSISVVLVPLLLAVFWRRRLRPLVWVSAAVALLGLYLLVGVPSGPPSPAQVSAWRGDGLVALCALAFGLQIVCLGEWVPRRGFRDLAVLQIVFAAVFVWLAVPVAPHPHWHSTPLLWTALAVTAVLATAVAFTVQSWSQQFTSATHTAVIFAAEPVFAWLASAWFWHEPMRGVQLAGAVLIVLAMLAVEWRPRRPLRAPDGARLE